MTHLEFKLPDIGEGVTEGEIVEWFVAVGDVLDEDAPMVEVMTDKATVSIGAPCAGRVVACHFEVGQVAQVGEVIVVLAPSDESGMDRAKRSSAPPATAVGELHDSLPGAHLFATTDRASPAPISSKPEGSYFESKPLATPATRRLAKERGLDLRRVRPTGAGGRVTDEDVHAAARDAGGHATPAPGDTQGRPSPRDAREERKPIVGIRRKIAERMAKAKSTAAHFTFVEECDASALLEIRGKYDLEASGRGVRLTYLPFVVRAVTDALARHPALNSAVDEATQELVYKNYYNVGVAVATEAGLVVPVIKEADRRPLFDLASEIERLSSAARDGSLRPEDLRDSTFTITSLGRQSGLLATPILNHPEVGILGVHRIKERPVVRDGHIVIGRVMTLSLSFDHRVVDGHVGAAFAYDVIETLEDPGRIATDFLP
ncbi:MAG: dihydrolipoamide acetyltransferase family protein [Myxococcota bacterium]